MKTWQVNKEALLSSNNWQRVIRKVGNYTYLYFFFILKEDGKTFILNTRTLKCASIQGINHKIIPLVLDLPREAFIYKEKNVYNSCKEFICIDNWILDSDFNQTFIETKYDSHPVILDTLDYYIAASDFYGIHLLEIIGFSRHSLNIKELQYYYKETKGGNSRSGLFMDDDFACFSAVTCFNPCNKQFFVDTDIIEREYKWAKNKRSQEIESTDYYDLINDGLDGEADAIWNII